MAEHYQEILLIAFIGSICFNAGQLVFQLKQQTKIESRIEALTKQVVQSRVENGIIIGCLYTISGSLSPQIKEIVENMLRRETTTS